MCFFIGELSVISGHHAHVNDSIKSKCGSRTGPMEIAARRATDPGALPLSFSRPGNYLDVK